MINNAIVKSQKDEIIVLADVSGSMSERDAGEGVQRIVAMKGALEALPPSVRIIAFNDTTVEVRTAREIPRPDGTTDLEGAIIAASHYQPVRTIIISDGEPNDEAGAIQALDRLSGVVDVIYCGSNSNTSTRKFLASLARQGMGSYYETGDQLDVSKQLPAVVKGLLGA